MSRLLPTEPIPVRIGACECPGTPHPEGDFAYLRPRLTPAGGMAATVALSQTSDAAELEGKWAVIFLRDGIVRWDLLDDAGKPISVAAAIGGAVEWPVLMPIADKAGELYAESVLAPFRPAKELTSSPTGQTDDSTSANQDS